MEKKYADLLIRYCVNLQPGETLLITSTWLAEPLLRELYDAALGAGGHPVLLVDIEGTEKILLEKGNEKQLRYVNPFFAEAIRAFDAYIRILAPFDVKELETVDPAKRRIRQEAMQPVMNTYFERLGSGSLKRSLCQYPTPAAAQTAGMSLEEYTRFVYNACYLFDENPVSKWLEVRAFQQKIVEYLNGCTEMRYTRPGTDLTFSTLGRKWINSDGKNNMPSGEVFTSPVEDSVNGHIYFSYPSVYMGRDVRGVSFEVKDGLIVSWDAVEGKPLLDNVLEMDGARRFGEAAVGTNNRIQQITRNILFDEKIGGSIHMAIGQSYRQTGGKNSSPLHWDLITDMKIGGKIYADGNLIYENGAFLI